MSPDALQKGRIMEYQQWNQAWLRGFLIADNKDIAPNNKSYQPAASGLL